MKFYFSDKMKKDAEKLKKENRKTFAKVLDIIFDILDSPFEGIGKPEALKGDMSGWWSRRITDKHRMIYRVINGEVEIISCYGHYGDK